MPKARLCLLAAVLALALAAQALQAVAGGGPGGFRLELVQAVELSREAVVVDAEPVAGSIVALIAGPQGFSVAKYVAGALEWSEPVEPPEGWRGFEPLSLDVVGESIIVYARGREGIDEALAVYRLGLAGGEPGLEAVYTLGESALVYGATQTPSGIAAFGSRFTGFETGWDPAVYMIDPAAGSVRLDLLLEMPGDNRAVAAAFSEGYACMVVESGEPGVGPAVEAVCAGRGGGAEPPIPMPGGLQAGVLAWDGCVVWWSGGKALASTLPPEPGAATPLKTLERVLAASIAVVGGERLLAAGGSLGGEAALALMSGCPPETLATARLGVEGAVASAWGGEGEIAVYVASPEGTALALYTISIPGGDTGGGAEEAQPPPEEEPEQPTPPPTTIALATILAGLAAAAVYLRLRKRRA